MKESAARDQELWWCLNVQDAAAAFAPRLIAVALVAIALAGWMSSKVIDFAVTMMGGG